MSQESTTNRSEQIPRIEDRNFFHLALIIVVGIFAVTLPQTAVLGNLPIRHLLKTELHMKPDQMAGFLFLTGLAWYLKPLCGILTDAFPIFGTRRRHYILISSVLAGICWVAVDFLPKTYEPLLLGLILVNLFMVMTSTVVGGFLVEAGQAMGSTGRLTSIRQAMFNGCSLISGVASGVLATQRFILTACLNGALVLSIFPVVYKFLHEKPQAPSGREKLHAAGTQLITILRCWPMWISVLLIGLYQFAPGFGTVIYYRQNDQLHFSQQYIGTLGSLGGGAGVLAALLYGLTIRRYQLRTLITLGIGINAAGTLFYLHYTSAGWAAFTDFQQGFTSGFAVVALLDLAARTVPKGCEGLGYSLMLSIYNVASNGGDVVGSRLYERAHWTFEHLVVVNAITTALALIFLPFIPAVFVQAKDGDVDAAKDSAASVRRFRRRP